MTGLSVFEYTYLLFWNVFWSLAPVIAIGIFDRNIGTLYGTSIRKTLLTLDPDDDILMAIPELYRYGREGRWFGSGTFVVFMLDGIYQVRAPYT
jgi:phospholipid-translocating ATPase